MPLPFLLLFLFLFAPAPAQAAAPPFRLTVLGDSLVAGYGLDAADAFPAQLERALRDRGCRVAVNNAGVSGDTTAGGRARLDWVLADAPQLVVVELGANDALRGLPPEAAADNLAAILARLQSRGIPALLVGMRAPRNLGAEYYIKFDALYPRLARRFQVPLYPFFLAGVTGVAELNQEDGIHPNRQGVAEIVRRILPLVKNLLGPGVCP